MNLDELVRRNYVLVALACILDKPAPQRTKLCIRFLHIMLKNFRFDNVDAALDLLPENERHNRRKEVIAAMIEFADGSTNADTFNHHMAKAIDQAKKLPGPERDRILKKIIDMQLSPKRDPRVAIDTALDMSCETSKTETLIALAKKYVAHEKMELASKVAKLLLSPSKPR